MFSSNPLYFQLFFSGGKWVAALLKGLSYWGLQLLTDSQLAILAAAFASSARGQSCF